MGFVSGRKETFDSMRAMQKNQILEILDSLQQAHEEIRKALWQKNNVLAQDIICECQKTAVSIGECIESSEGEKHVTVSYLEEYCELLFGIYAETGGKNNVVSGNSGVGESAAAADKASVNGNKTYKSLRRQLVKIENSVRDDIPAKKEVVFFPYKASMWDSLESVYLAAKEDPDCDAYCVPIPYYDLNPDRSFGEMHDEKNQYPENIEITDWQTYHFEERRPDEIYIHNGYDNWNLVTSVHPRFYSGNLKKYTEKLIYIPYFVLNEIEPDNQAAVEGMKHFCFMPGIIYADKVIVQSEKMKQIYVNEYLKAAKENGLTGKHLDREHLERKFLGLGSPKIDKVLNTKKEDLEIPKEWLKVIQKPDGSFKKIVFYNTGISALLAHNEKWVEKIEDVLKIFKENQEDVALLWRPHPLIENTMRSMRPGILEWYQQIKRQYLEEGWGIYDDTADVDRAVVLSDVYYGDWSSVVQMYRQMGKLAIMQVPSIMSKETDLYFKSEIFLIVEKRAWGASIFENMYFSVDLITGQTNIEGIFEKEEENYLLYNTALRYENEIYWIPYSAKEIAVYNLETKKMQKIEIPFNNVKWNSGIKFGVAVLLGDCIYAFGYRIPIIMEINCLNKAVRCIDISCVIDAKKDIYLFKNAYVLDGDKIYLPFQQSNKILLFHFSTKEFLCYEVEPPYNKELKSGYTEIIKHDSFWLYNWNDEVIHWTPQTGVIGKQNIYALEKYEYKTYKKIFNNGNKNIQFPWFADEIIVKDLETENVKKISLKEKLLSETMQSNTARYHFIQEDGDEIWFQVSRNRTDNRELFVLDKKILGIKKVTMKLDKNAVKSFNTGKLKNYFDKGMPINENPCLSLQTLIEALK